MAGLKRIEAPTMEPVGVDFIKPFIRMYADDLDQLIERLIPMAREAAEEYSRRAFLTQTWEQTFSADQLARQLVLHRPPLQSVVSVTFKDTEGVETVVNTSNYLVDTGSELGSITLTPNGSWCVGGNPHATEAIRVRFVCGVATDAELDESTKLSVASRVANLIDNPANPELNDSEKSLLGRGRRWMA